MTFHGFNAGLQVGVSLLFIFNETRLQKAMLSLDALILRQILTKKNDFQFVAMR